MKFNVLNIFNIIIWNMQHNLISVYSSFVNSSIYPNLFDLPRPHDRQGEGLYVTMKITFDHKMATMAFLGMKHTKLFAVPASWIPVLCVFSKIIFYLALLF